MTHVVGHQAFVEAVQLELADYQDTLTFEPSQPIITEPKTVAVFNLDESSCKYDHQETWESIKLEVTLTIKKRGKKMIPQNFAQIFKKLNFLKYIDSNNSFSIYDSHALQAYNMFYAAENDSDPTNHSITIVTQQIPHELLKQLKNTRNTTLDKNNQNGIYTINRVTSPTQLVVMEMLSDKENPYLASLREGLTVDQLSRVLTEIAQLSKNKNISATHFVNTVIEMNINVFHKIVAGKKLNNYLKQLGLMNKDYTEEVADDKIEKQILTILCLLKDRFDSVPMTLQEQLFTITDPSRLDLLLQNATHCSSLESFTAMLQ